MIEIREEVPWDRGAREDLLDRAFGPDRLGKTSELLRFGRLPRIALSAEDADTGALVGTVRLWDVTVASGERALLLGPLAVEPSLKGGGLGSQLMRSSLNRAAIGGHKAVILVGDAAYYERFGFQARLTQALDMPGPVERERFMALELVEGATATMCGVLSAAGPADPAWSGGGADVHFKPARILRA